MSDVKEKTVVLVLSKHEAAFLAAVMHKTRGSKLASGITSALVKSVGATAIVNYVEQMKGNVDVASK